MKIVLMWCIQVLKIRSLKDSLTPQATWVTSPFIDFDLCVPLVECPLLDVSSMIHPTLFSLRVIHCIVSDITMANACHMCLSNSLVHRIVLLIIQSVHAFLCYVHVCMNCWGRRHRVSKVLCCVSKGFERRELVAITLFLCKSECGVFVLLQIPR